MAERTGLASTVSALAPAVYKCCQILHNAVDGLRETHYIRNLSWDLEGHYAVLGTLQAVLQDDEAPAVGTECAASGEIYKSLNQSMEIMNQLTRIVQRHRVQIQTRRPDVWEGNIWEAEEKEVNGLRNLLLQCKSTLGVAICSANENDIRSNSEIIPAGTYHNQGDLVDTNNTSRSIDGSFQVFVRHAGSHGTLMIATNPSATVQDLKDYVRDKINPPRAEWRFLHSSRLIREESKTLRECAVVCDATLTCVSFRSCCRHEKEYIYINDLHRKRLQFDRLPDESVWDLKCRYAKRVKKDDQTPLDPYDVDLVYRGEILVSAGRIFNLVDGNTFTALLKPDVHLERGSLPRPCSVPGAWDRPEEAARRREGALPITEGVKDLILDAADTETISEGTKPVQRHSRSLGARIRALWRRSSVRWMWVRRDARFDRLIPYQRLRPRRSTPADGYRLA